MSALALTLAVGCSEEEPGQELGAPVDDSLTHEVRYGALTAEFLYPRAWESEGVAVQAHFIHARGVAVGPALDALEMWTPTRGLATGTCEAIDGQRSAMSSEQASLHLLDVGDIAVEAPTADALLAPRRLPDLLNAFYGVVYGSEWAWESQGAVLDYFPGALYRFAAPGGPHIGGFDQALAAPDPMVLVGINGAELRGQEAALISDSRPVDLVWELGVAQPATEVYIDVSAGFGPERRRVQCRTTDDGAFSVPGALLRPLWEEAETLELVVRRVRHEEVGLEGLDEADFFFTAADRLELNRR
ncbi:hypothetical protein DL240_18015 [Lujinxingia litoralis]|uniref:Uncharacterized protein n=1 Tax=Lujinxingia litoralis TaxID=2211119 RepID=A0A328C2Y8_9DELT|nr:hypothetical protein DL240_18015 [Lujinxingia litoralis]